MLWELTTVACAKPNRDIDTMKFQQKYELKKKKKLQDVISEGVQSHADLKESKTYFLPM